jgi:cation:H+ antiporter
LNFRISSCLHWSGCLGEREPLVGGSAIWAAEVFRIPQHIIGATIVSICTTLPETFVSSAAALKNEASMAAGSALGSIGVNMGLLLSVLILSYGPKISNRKDFFKHVGFLLLLLALLWGAGFFIGEITRSMALILVLLLLLYIVGNVYFAARLMDLDIQYDIVYDREGFQHYDPHTNMPEGKVYDEKENDFDISFQVLLKKCFFFCLGVFLVVLGSNLMVDNGIRIAEFYQKPHYVISIVFISIGTSLPS